MPGKIGEGTKNLSINVPEEFHTRLFQLAKACEPPLSAGEYARRLLSRAMERNPVYKSRLVEEEKTDYSKEKKDALDLLERAKEESGNKRYSRKRRSAS